MKPHIVPVSASLATNYEFFAHTKGRAMIMFQIIADHIIRLLPINYVPNIVPTLLKF